MKPTRRGRVRPVKFIFPALIFIAASVPVCQAGTVGMGSSGMYAVLGLNNNTIVSNQGTVNGSLGIAGYGPSFSPNIAGFGPSVSSNTSTVNGNVVDANAGWFSNKGNISGQAITSAATLTQNISDANAMYNTALSLSPGKVYSSISAPTTITGNDGLNIVSVAGNITNSLTLNGSANSFFVVLVNGNVSLGDSQSLAVSGGVTADHVLYVLNGSNGTVTTGMNDVINGTLLAPGYSATLNGTVNGAILAGGQSINIQNAVINANPFAGILPAVPVPAEVPEPAAYFITGLGLLVLLGFARLLRRARPLQSR